MQVLSLDDDGTVDLGTDQTPRGSGDVMDLVTDGNCAPVAVIGQDCDTLRPKRIVLGSCTLSILNALRHAKVTVRAMFLTALGEVDDSAKGQRAGDNGDLVKPFLRVKGGGRTRATFLERMRDTDFGPPVSAVQTHISRPCARVESPIRAMLICTLRSSGYVLETA